MRGLQGRSKKMRAASVLDDVAWTTLDVRSLYELGLQMLSITAGFAGFRNQGVMTLRCANNSAAKPVATSRGSSWSARGLAGAR